jgi:hypothetical protein
VRLALKARSRWLLLLCATPSLLLAQESRRTIQEGERVRITARSDTGIYLVRGVSGDTLVAQLPSSKALTYFPFMVLRKVEVSREPEEFYVQPLRRGLIAAAGAGLAGGLVAYAEGNEEDPYARPRDKMAFARNVGGAFALIGLAGGVISGLINNGERWERVPLPPRLSAAAPSDSVPSTLPDEASAVAVKEGDRVRITAQSDTGIFIVRAVSRDTLTVQPLSSNALVSFPVKALRQLEVRRASADPDIVITERGREGGLIGAGAGGVLGLVVAEPKYRAFAAAGGAAVLGATGYALGVMTRHIHGERWERVSLPTRVSVSASPNGVFALSYSF